MQPWVLARLLLGATALLLAVVASAGAARVLSGWHLEAPADARTLRLEREGELLGALLDAAFALALLGSLLTVVAADRLAPSLRGAMCAYGVVHTGSGGAQALTVSLLAALGCAAWRGARAVDLRLPRGTLLRPLAAGALGLTALLAFDLTLSGRFLLGLDFTVVASCCTRVVDAARQETGDGAAPWRTLALALASGLLAMLSHARLWRNPSALAGLLAGALGLLAAGLSGAALSRVAAPFVFETPAHPCAYCLLHSEAQPLGLALLLAWSAAGLTAARTLGVAWAARREGARKTAEALLREESPRGALLWAVTLGALLAPLARYATLTGGLGLFR